MNNKININKSSILHLVSFALLGGMISCNSYLEETDLPRLTPVYYGTQAGVEAAATAAYSYMRWPASGEMYNRMTELGTDLFTCGEESGDNHGWGLYETQLNPDDALLYNYWNNAYKAISTTNLVIQQVEESSALTETQKQAAIAEMSFIRAVFYFDLVRQYGSIPLVLDVAFEVRTEFKRAPVAEIYTQIIKDLEYATQYLPEKPAMTGKATRYSAFHLLAKVYLTRGSAITEQRGQQPTDMDNALKYAKEVIGNEQFDLVEDFGQLWNIHNQGNKEVVFAVQFSYDPIYRANGGSNGLNFSFGSWYEDQPGMTRDVANDRPYRRHRQTNKVMFELFDRKNDSRFYKSFKWAYYCNKTGTHLAIGDTAIYYSIKPTTESYPYKYFAWNKDDVKQNNRYYPPLLKYFDPLRVAMNDAGGREWVRMRLGETYLIAAEAAGRNGDFQTAADYINKLRKRAAWHDGETKVPQYSIEEGGAQGDTHDTYPEIEVKVADLQNNFIDFILDERGRELLGETDRWCDLVRCEKLKEYVDRWNPDATVNIKPHHKLRPIPQKHIDRLKPQGTPAEEQNEGYY